MNADLGGAGGRPVASFPTGTLFDWLATSAIDTPARLFVRHFRSIDTRIIRPPAVYRRSERSCEQCEWLILPKLAGSNGTRAKRRGSDATPEDAPPSMNERMR